MRKPRPEPERTTERQHTERGPRAYQQADGCMRSTCFVCKQLIEDGALVFVQPANGCKRHATCARLPTKVQTDDIRFSEDAIRRQSQTPLYHQGRVIRGTNSLGG